MNYQCKAWDCSHSFDIETKEDKIALFANCPRCGCVAELREGALTPREMMKHLGYDCIEQDIMARSTLFLAARSLTTAIW